MKCQAAVLRGVGKDWEIHEVDLDPPHAGEVLVKMSVAGICHSDDHFATGDTVPSEDMVEMMLAEYSVPMILTDMIYSNKQLKGTLYGGMNPWADIPRFLSIYQSGGLKLDEMVTRRYRLDQINDAIIDLREGRNIPRRHRLSVQLSVSAAGSTIRRRHVRRGPA